ncbi:MAG: TonB family protein [Alphaproteobacteria bacterium]|nr:TonB family protein [Alphaproteobacteria bacterium]
MELLEKKSKRAWPTYLFAAVVAIALIGALGYGLMKLFSKSEAPRRQVVHNIALLKPPPPPPPKPPEKPPEPQMKKEEVKVEQPKPDAPKQDDAPAGKQLGVDAEGGAGSDGFGLVGNKGGRDLLGGGRMGFAFYTNGLQRFLQDELAKNRKLRGADYRIVVRLWLARDGAVQRVELAGSSGNPDVDAQVRSALGALAAVKEAPPENMPQPVKLRISNRGAG